MQTGREKVDYRHDPESKSTNQIKYFDNGTTTPTMLIAHFKDLLMGPYKFPDRMVLFQGKE